MIRQANDLAKTERGNDPIVITFVHGWKNNAAETNGNVAGFEAALQEVYRRFGKSHHVIGIFIGWRGNLIKDSWPVQQQLSYYNREATAIRVPGASLSSALTQIATRTHENEHALAIYIGHSFGGLLLERTLSEATASQIAQTTIFTQEANAAPKGSQEANEKAVAAEARNRRARRSRHLHQSRGRCNRSQADARFPDLQQIQLSAHRAERDDRRHLCCSQLKSV